MENSYQGNTIVVYRPCLQGDVLFIQHTNALSQTLCVLASTGCYSVAVFGIRNNGLTDLSPDKIAVARIGYLLIHYYDCILCMCHVYVLLSYYKVSNTEFESHKDIISSDGYSLNKIVIATLGMIWYIIKEPDLMFSYMIS